LKSLLYLLAFVLFVFFQPYSAEAADGFLDFPSFFSSPDTSRVFTEFGMSVFDSNEQFLYSSMVSGRMNSRLTGRFSVPYFSIRRDDRVLFGFSDFAVNLTFRAAGDTLGNSGIFLRTDINLPSGSKALEPFANRSFDGGAGVEVRKRFALFSLKMAATYIFAGDRNALAPYPHSNYRIIAAEAGFHPGSFIDISVSAYSVDYRKSAERLILLSGISGRMSDSIRIILSGGVEAGEEYERHYDSMVSVRFSYLFPTPIPQE